MPKKIIQISPYSFDHPGGVEQYAKTLQSIFPEDMITFSGGKEFSIIEPIAHCPLPTFWKKGFWYTFSEISKENTKAIISHIRFAPTSWLAFFIAKRKGIPYIHIEHGTGFLIHKNPIVAFIAKLVDYTIGKYILRNAEKVICISEAGKTWVMSNFGRNENISVIYRGFEFPSIDRRKNKIPKIGFVGRLIGLKNVGGLIHALSEIRNLDWALEIVGDGEERKNLENLTEKLGISERVLFYGAMTHDWIMKEFYPNIDIFVNPSLQEGLPTTVIEALGMGCSVIATDVGGTKEIDKGILIPPGDKVALTNEIENRLLRIYPPFSIENFSLESMRAKYKSIFSLL